MIYKQLNIGACNIAKLPLKLKQQMSQILTCLAPYN